VARNGEGGGERELYDPFETNWLDDPYECYRELRRRGPVYTCRRRDVYVLSRFTDVQAALRDWDSFSNTPSADLDDTGGVLGEGSFIDTDPPDHPRMRDVVRRFFAPKELQARLEVPLAEEIQIFLDSFSERREADIANELAWPLPISMMCVLLGLPRTEHATLRPWLEDMARREFGSPQAPMAARRAAESLGDYIAAAIEVRRSRPQDDILSSLATAEGEGTLAPGETIGLARLLCVAGVETTASSISNALWLFATHPDERSVIAKDQSCAAEGVEEILRYESPIQTIVRSTKRDVMVEGTQIPQGARVVLLVGSANRDERRFDAPDVLDVRRTSARHVAFGEGIHHCVGAPLARLETKTVLEILLPRLGEYEVVGQVVRHPSHVTRGLSSLQIALA
jgi:cytochrome P450